MTNPVRWLAKAAERVALRFGSATAWWLQSIGGSAYDYVRAVGDARANAIVYSCLNWEATQFPEAPAMVYRKVTGSRDLAEQPDHPLLGLLERPNPYYSGEHLWAATVADRRVTGNAYWIKVRSGAGRVVELYWIPSDLMEPRWEKDSGNFIDWYDYSPDGFPLRVPREDVVHFRLGFDPRNIRKGLAPLYALMREIASDNEAANWTASLLRNQGVPGVIVSPQSADDRITPEDTEQIKGEINQRFTGDRRGEALVMAAPTNVQILSFSPKQMDMSTVRRLPEERVSACFGVPAIVAGLGAGLQRATYANFAEARRMAYESNIIPTQRLLGSEIESQLIPDFGDARVLRFGFDNSKVRLLQTDEDELHKRAREDWLAGLLTRNQALQLIGEPPEAGTAGDVVLIPTNVSPMLVSDLLALREQPARVTIADPGARVPEPTPDPAAPPPAPADIGLVPPQPQPPAAQPPRTPKALTDTLAKLLPPEMVDAVLDVLRERPAGMSAVEHAETVLREAQAMTGSRNGHH